MGLQEQCPAFQDDGRIGCPSETYYPLGCTALLGDVVGTHPTATSICSGYMMSALVYFVLTFVMYWNPAVIVRYYGRSLNSGIRALKSGRKNSFQTSHCLILTFKAVSKN